MGIGLMYHYRQDNSSIAQTIGTQIAVGIGGGMLNVSAQLAVQASVPSHRNVAVAAAVFMTCVEMGGAVRSAIAGVIWAHGIPLKLAEFSDTIDSKAVYNSIMNALAYPMGSPERIAIDRAYQETMHKLLVGALCVSAPIAVLALVIRNAKLDEGEDKVKGRVIGRRRMEGEAWGARNV